MYGIGSDDRLYTLPNSYFVTYNWIWSSADWAPHDIKHISTTHDSSHMWIQTDSIGIIYSDPSTIVSKILYPNNDPTAYDTPSHKLLRKRVYGRDTQHYIDINRQNYTARVHPSNTLVNNVFDAALSYYDEVMAIHPSDRQEYRGITIVNWLPYYIRV